MINTDYCQMMAGYKRWMNDKIYEISGGLSDADRKSDRKLFFRSIHSTLNHDDWQAQ